MKRTLLAAALLAAAGCSGEPVSDRREVRPPTGHANDPVTTATLVEQPAAETPVPVGVDGPEAVIREYVALAAAGRTREAGRLWADVAAATGANEVLAGLIDPGVTITGETELGAGAGQRYATVPVRVTGQRGGVAIDRRGEVVLHRVADGIETADPTAHRWRIRSASFGQLPAMVDASYRCGDGTRLAVQFDNHVDTARVTVAGRRLALASQRPASGIWYAGQGYMLRGKGNRATFTRPDGLPTSCTAS